jgi:hypothetical protein
MPAAEYYALAPALGEGIGAAGLWQVITAAKAISDGKLPPLLHGPSAMPFGLLKRRAKAPSATDIIVLTCGLNQQLAGLRLCAA